MADDPKTVVFFPEGAFGPTNNCVGIGNVLKQRGHRVVFIIEESFAGTLAAKGFEERLMRLGPAPAEPEEPGQFWKDFVRETAPVFRQPTIDQLEGFIAPTFEALIEGSRYVEPRLKEIFAELEPDVVVEDNVVCFPAATTAGCPWVRIVSCNPLEVKDPAVAPTFSGLPAADTSDWDEFTARYLHLTADMHADFNSWCVAQGAPAMVPGDFIPASPDLNLYLYPEEADYRRSLPLDGSWHNLQTSVRDTDDAWELPEKLRGQDGPLVYLSLGSLGSADTTLMQRLCDMLAGTRYRVIVSEGPSAGELVLGDNMHGAEFLPQTNVLPQVDLVITHGGNNTTTECFWFGKPMIVMPLFWDQHDNAQRVDELGFGRRFDGYRVPREELLEAIDRLLGDAALNQRLRGISQRLQREPGTVKAADLIEQLVRDRAGASQ